jgi:hypothetical protein
MSSTTETTFHPVHHLVFNNREYLASFEDCQSLEEIEDRMMDLSCSELEEVLASVANLTFTI